MKHRKMKQQLNLKVKQKEVTEIETVEETSSEEPEIDLSTATKEDILYYIEAIGGDESDAFYAFIGSLGDV